MYQQDTTFFSHYLVLKIDVFTGIQSDKQIRINGKTFHPFILNSAKSQKQKNMHSSKLQQLRRR